MLISGTDMHRDIFLLRARFDVSRERAIESFHPFLKFLNHSRKMGIWVFLCQNHPQLWEGGAPSFGTSKKLSFKCNPLRNFFMIVIFKLRAYFQKKDRF